MIKSEILSTLDSSIPLADSSSVLHSSIAVSKPTYHVTYDEETGRLLGVSKSPRDGRKSVEIDAVTAMRFLTGKQKLSQWIVVNHDGVESVVPRKKLKSRFTELDLFALNRKLITYLPDGVKVTLPVAGVDYLKRKKEYNLTFWITQEGTPSIMKHTFMIDVNTLSSVDDTTIWLSSISSPISIYSSAKIQ